MDQKYPRAAPVVKFKSTRLASDALQLICTYLTTSEHVTVFNRCCKHWDYCARQPASWIGVTFMHARDDNGASIVQKMMAAWNLQRIVGFRSPDALAWTAGDILALKSTYHTLRVLDLNIVDKAHPLWEFEVGTLTPDRQIELCETLPSLVNLTELRLSYLTCDPHIRALPTDWLKCLPTSLRSLSLPMARGHMRHGLLAKTCPNLTQLDVRRSYLYPAIEIQELEPFFRSTYFAELREMPSLTKADFSQSIMNAHDGLSRDVAQDTFMNITDLNLSSCKLHRCTSSACLQSNPWMRFIPATIRRLVLWHNEIKALDFLPNNCMIEELDVSYNPLGFDCLGTLQVTSCPKLRRVVVTGTRITLSEVVLFHRNMSMSKQYGSRAPVIIVVKEKPDPFMLEQERDGGDDIMEIFDQEEVLAELDRVLNNDTTSESSGSESEDKQWTGDEAEESDSDSETPKPRKRPSKKTRRKPAQKGSKRTCKKRKAAKSQKPARKRRKVAARKGK